MKRVSKTGSRSLIYQGSHCSFLSPVFHIPNTVRVQPCLTTSLTLLPTIAPLSDMMLSLLAFFGFLLALAGASPASTRDISASTTTTNTPTTPTPCHYKAFDKPWILKDITIFTPSGQGNSSNATAHGTVSFHFCDRNARLLLETDCSGDVIGDACEAGDGGYVSCENANVGFKLASGGVVMVERWYEDNWWVLYQAVHAFWQD